MDINEILYDEDLLEDLAALAHKQWSGWMEYLFSKCEVTASGLVIPDWANARWTRQMQIAYANLPEEEKESDRVEARKVLDLIANYRPVRFG